MNRKLWLAISLISTSALPGPVAVAQNEQLEEVLVTARKRLENLQEIPVSVSAFNSEIIKARDMRSLEDLAGSTTGLVFENYSTSGLSSAPVIRGMALPFTTAREQNTSVFLDGVYLQRQSMLNPGLAEMERIEVVKGPQSAIYGRNAFAGAINYITKKPTEELDGTAGLTYGTGDRLDYSLNVGGPIVKDRLLGRIAYAASEFDGHTDNDHPYDSLNPTGDNTEDALGGWDDEMFSGALQFRASERLIFDISYYQNESDREPQPFYNLDGARQTDVTDQENTLNCLDTTTNVATGPVVTPVSGNHAYCGEFSVTAPYREDLADLGYEGQILLDPRSFAVGTDTELWTARVEWDFADNWSMKYLFGYTDHEAAGTGVQADHKSLTGEGVVSGVNFVPGQGIVFEYTDTTIFNSNPEEELEATSHELQLAWDAGGDWRLRGGLYYSNVEDASWNTFRFPAPCDSAAICKSGVLNSPSVLPSDFPPGSGHDQRGSWITYEDDIYAVFAEAIWDATETISLGLEARYTLEEKSFEQLSGAFGSDQTAKEDEDFRYFTPRFTAQYQWKEESMLYGSLGKGVKTGGFNVIDESINPEQAVYDEEENWSLELGSKNTLLDNSLVLNGAAYYIRWKDQQGTEAANDPNPYAIDVIGNIGDVDVWGLELEASYFLTESWSIDGGYSWSKPEFDKAIYSPAVADENSSFGCDDVVCPSDGDVSGNLVQRASEHQAQIALNYRTELQDWNLDARIDANYRSKMYGTPLNLAHNGSRTIANLSVSLSNENWNLSFWGKNIFDEEYVANTFVLPSFSGYLVALGPRDTWGLTARYNF